MGITREQALDCFYADDLIGIGMEADAVRRALHPAGVVSYLIDRKIDLSPAPELLETVMRQVREALEMGGTGVSLRLRAGSELTLDQLESLLGAVHQRFPSVWLHGLSATAVIELAAGSDRSVAETLERLQASGLHSLAGDDAYILDDLIRRLCEPCCSAADWLLVHQTAHRLGIRSSASMRFGFGESMEQRVSHLQLLHKLQQATGGFSFFTASAYHPGDPSQRRSLEEPTSVESLKTLAIARMVLDNIENMQSEASTHGLKVLQMSLRFGSNDAGSVLSSSGLGATEEELRRVIRDAGFKPVQRDTLYRTMFLN